MVNISSRYREVSLNLSMRLDPIRLTSEINCEGINNCHMCIEMLIFAFDQ